MQHKLIIITIALFLLSFESIGQVNTSSPYSRFGIGEIENQTLGRTASMGGISSGLRLPFEINMNNPASYSAIPRNIFLFQVGLQSQRTDYITNNSETFGLYPSNVVLDVAVGQMLLTTTNGEALLSLQLEQSSDLISNSWTNAGDAVEWVLPVDLNKHFFRVRSAPDGE